MLAAYADVFPGIFAFIVLILVAFACVVWLVIWTVRGFRSYSSGAEQMIKASVLLAVILTAMACFPPFRCLGDWQHVETGAPIPSPFANIYDRYYFGYSPKYRWVGQVRATEVMEPGVVVEILNADRYEMKKFRWDIDWYILAGQGVIVLLFFLPYLRARSRQAKS